MNGEDAGKLHLKQGDRIELVSDCGRLACRVQVAPMAPGNLQVHWPEGNVLIPRGLVDAGGGVPDSNNPVRIERLSKPSPLRFGFEGTQGISPVSGSGVTGRVWVDAGGREV